MIFSKTVLQEVDLIQQTIGESELRVASDRPVEQTDRFLPILQRNRSTSTPKGRAGAKIKIIGLQILCGLLPNLILFAGGESCFELACNRLRDLTLEREDGLQLAIVLLRPNLRVGLGVDELGVNPDASAGNLHASFQHISNSQIASNLLH